MARQNNRTVDSSEVAAFCSQIGLILDAGLPLYDGLESMSGSAEGSGQEDLYRSVRDGMNETGTLHGALKKDDRWPDYMVELTGIGEQTGQLEYVMKGLSDYYERESRIRAAITSAVTYPLVLGILLIAIVLTMVWKVLPVFRRVLGSMGTDIGGGAMIRLGSGIGYTVLVLVVLLVAAVLAAVLMLRTSKRERVLQLLRRIFPPVGKLDLKLNTSRVASVLSIMLESGFGSLEAFRILPTVLSNPEVKEKAAAIYGKLENGAGTSEALAESGLFPGLDERMIRVGCATGREAQVMRKLADGYEEDVEEGISRLIAIIEPTLIALLAVVIGAILLAVMFPMIGMLTNAF